MSGPATRQEQPAFMLDNDTTETDERTTRGEGDAATPAKKAARKAPAKRGPRKAKATNAADGTPASPSSTEVTAAPPADAAESAEPARVSSRSRAPRTARAAKAASPAPAAASETSEAVNSASEAIVAVGAASEPAAEPKKSSRTRKAAAKKSAPTADLGGDAAVAITAETVNLESGNVESGNAESGNVESVNAERAAAASQEAAAPTKAKRTPRKRGARAADAELASDTADGQPTDVTDSTPALATAPAIVPPVVLFQAPAEGKPARRGRVAKKAAPDLVERPLVPEEDDLDDESADVDADVDTDSDLGGDNDSEGGQGRRRRRRGRRGRGSRSESDTRSADSRDSEADPDSDDGEDADAPDVAEEAEHAEEVAEAALSASARRRRRRRRSSGGSDDTGAEDDPPNTVVHVRDTRESRSAGRGQDADSDGVRGVKGSTRLEAKRQRRRDNRDSGRRRAPILTEAEFLARREAVDRVMAVRQTGDRTQIAVLEDDILVEHYVTRASAASAVGNVYLGRVQNVLPSMEAAFVDIGRGRNGVLYAGEVNWDAAGLEGKSRAIEHAMSSGDSVLVQVTKDPIGHKGARLTSQVSLPGRFVVYVPGGGMTGISRKLPDTERSRLKSILKKVVPEDAGVIVRTAAEGASEADLISDVERLKTQWEAIQAKASKPGNGPSLVYGEPDLAIRVVRDVFNDDFKQLLVSGTDLFRTLSDYVADVAPDLSDRISPHTAESDLFADLRVDEQLSKALDRKVYLPSGGSLVIDRTEAMVVIDVNTGKYTGSGGNLEQTVTRNNLEAAEEIVRQLRLRDIGGIVVIDFIDMVLESNRDLVLRRLTECLGRDRTKHQVAEVTSLGLVQMTRKRVGEGLLEAFSETCEHCKGRGVIVHSEPVERKGGGGSPAPEPEEERPARGRRSRGGRKATSPDVDAETSAAEAEKRRAAASAIAAIAAATTHHDEHETSGTPVASVSDGAQAAVSDAVEAGVEPAVESAGSATPETTSVERVATVATASNGRPRRRRAASRPAGPPVAVGEPVGGG
ncbi:Rne/Rng family ribonuclease [Jatrophihabitans telluris]|uniref:Rne/Rng family ribonuclease n=1 Tax=Jatrophihabitans telluris TaxID=2038343 RepID=A0ABY4R1L2_9ACTN|nr:Rne/Rng family ribonuclease [Jatrophihabitans telluris]UQX89678.1 Rne/Rng family ribonuclease [Jatrophihabitans telluris]